MLTPTQQAENLRIIRRRRVQELTGIARSTMYDKMNETSPRYDASFPKAIKLGGSAVGWLEHEVLAWINGRVALSRPGASHA